MYICNLPQLQSCVGSAKTNMQISIVTVATTKCLATRKNKLYLFQFSHYGGGYNLKYNCFLYNAFLLWSLEHHNFLRAYLKALCIQKLHCNFF